MYSNAQWIVCSAFYALWERCNVDPDIIRDASVTKLAHTANRIAYNVILV